MKASKTIHDISEPQWDEIKKLCNELRLGGEFGGDIAKCMVYAFVIWVSTSKVEVAIEVADYQNLH